MQKTKEESLFFILGLAFITNALLAEFIGVKIFSVELSTGITPFKFELLGAPFEGINMTAGAILWPLVFIISDLVNEYFGKKGVQILSWSAAALILYAFVATSVAIWLVPAGFWETDPITGINMNLAFQKIFGQGRWIIAGSLVAFLLGQLLDVTVFLFFKRITGTRYLWLRATGSTLISQLIDSFVVLFIAFYLGAGWSLTEKVIPIGIVNYAYKFIAALCLTPLLYLLHYAIDTWLGTEKSQQLIDKVGVEEPEASDS